MSLGNPQHVKVRKKRQRCYRFEKKWPVSNLRKRPENHDREESQKRDEEVL